MSFCTSLHRMPCKLRALLRVISKHVSINPRDIDLLHLRPFTLFGVGASSFQFPRSPILSFFPPFSFMSFLITSLHLSFGLPIFLCPPTSMFSLLHLLQSFSPHALTISVSLLLFSHLCLPRMFSIIFPHIF